MKFLVDTNLPPALATWLVSAGYAATHTSEVGLARATDREIWRQAAEVGAVVVTKDEDFIILKTSDPDGPCVVWVRIGNAVRRVIIERISKIWPAVVAQLESGEQIVEIR
ncbi:MAG: DUF5615 family PIN-like protein [Hyphomicrobium sp.]